MYMNPLTLQRPKLQTAAIKYFLAEEYNFEQGTLLGTGIMNSTGQFIDVGTVLGQITQGAWSVAAAVAGGSNAGNGTVALGSPAAIAGAAQVGTYKAVALAALEWEVYDPNGKLLGVAADAAAFSNQIAFTIAHGSTPFAAGDVFTFAITDAAGAGQYTALNLSATDGSQNAVGVAAKAETAQAGADNINGLVVLARGPAVLLADGLVWPSGITSTQQAAALAQLAALGIIVRNS